MDLLHRQLAVPTVVTVAVEVTEEVVVEADLTAETVVEAAVMQAAEVEVEDTVVMYKTEVDTMIHHSEFCI